MNPLQVFPRHPSAPDTYYINGAWAPAAITAVDKRFTDAELAAEWQRARLVSYVRHKRTQNSPGNMALFDHCEKGLDEEWLLERFATLPHHDDGPV